VAATKAERLLPSLAPYPPSAYVVVHHPDVQLTPEEWIELADYEKVESDALADPGVVGFMRKPAKVAIPLHVAAAKISEGRGI
jgi:hypothetical protein